MLLKMTVGKILKPPVSLFCVIYDGLTVALNHLKQSNRSAFPWPCPAFCYSHPNPFHLLALSNFTQSSRSWSWKRGIWPARPENRSLFLFPGRRSTAPRLALARNYEGYFRRGNLKNTWDIRKTHTEKSGTHSADPQRQTVKRGLDTYHGTRPFIYTPPPGSVPPPAGVQPSSGRRPESTPSSGNLYTDVGADREAWKVFFSPLCALHTFCQSHVCFELMWVIWNYFRSCHAIKHLYTILTVSIAGPFKRFISYL